MILPPLVFPESYNIFSQNDPRTGVSIIKPFMTVIKFVTQCASKFVKPSKQCLTTTKALAYYTTEFIMAVRRFMSKVLGDFSVLSK